MFNEIKKDISFDLTEFNSKILIFSDLHFYKHRGSEFFLDIVEKILHDVLSILDRTNIKTVFFLGDWFHKKEKVGTEELSITSKFLHSLREREIKMLMFVGNHDYLYKSEDKSENNTIECFNVMDNVYIVNKYYSFTTYNNKQLHFFRWSNSVTQEYIDGKVGKGDNYCFAHWELNNVDVNGIVLMSDKSNVDTTYLNNKFKYSFLGHYHSAMKKHNVLFVGAPYHQNFNSVGKKCGFFTFDVNDDSIKFIENDKSPKFIKIYASELEVNKPEDIKALPYKDSFIRIVLDKKMSNTILSDIKEELMKNNHLVECVLDYEDNLEFESGTEEAEQQIKEQLMVLDLNSELSTKKFFKEYLDLFKELPAPLNKEKMNEIIDGVV